MEVVQQLCFVHISLYDVSLRVKTNFNIETRNTISDKLDVQTIVNLNKYTDVESVFLPSEGKGSSYRVR